MMLSAVATSCWLEFDPQLTLLQSVTRTVKKFIKANKLRRDACKSNGGGVGESDLKSFKSCPRTGDALTALACFILVLIFVGTAFAAKHPVPLDPKADPSTCIACHEDKTKGKSVHSAIAMGCTSCHEIRTTKDVTRVKLITTTPKPCA